MRNDKKTILKVTPVSGYCACYHLLCVALYIPEYCRMKCHQVLLPATWKTLEGCEVSFGRCLLQCDQDLAEFQRVSWLFCFEVHLLLN